METSVQNFAHVNSLGKKDSCSGDEFCDMDEKFSDKVEPLYRWVTMLPTKAKPYPPVSNARKLRNRNLSIILLTL